MKAKFGCELLNVKISSSTLFEIITQCIGIVHADNICPSDLNFCVANFFFTSHRFSP